MCFKEIIFLLNSKYMLQAICIWLDLNLIVLNSSSATINSSSNTINSINNSSLNLIVFKNV